MSKHYPVGVAALAEGGYGLGALLDAGTDRGAEAVHADHTAALHHRDQVVEVRRVAGVADHDATEVHPLGLEDVLLGGAGTGEGECVRIGTPVARCVIAAARSISRFSAVTSSSVATLMAPALMPVSAMPSSMSRMNSSTIGSGVWRRKKPGTWRCTPVATTICMRVPAHLTQQRHVPADVEGGQIDDRAHAGVAEFVQRLAGVRDLAPGVEEMRPVEPDRQRGGDDVLVHEGRAEVGRLDRPPRGLNGGHGCSPVRSEPPVGAGRPGTQAQ